MMNEPSNALEDPIGCLGDLLDSIRVFDDLPALLTPGRPALSYRGLREHMDRIGDRLTALGIGRNDRVAAALPNGPEAVMAFLGVARVATFAPLNPALVEAEFAFFLRDLRPKAMLVPASASSASRAAAQSLNIPLIEVDPRLDDAAGLFDLSCNLPNTAEALTPGQAGPENAALILYTSGTTSRPKQVPLLHRNLLASILHTRDTLQLTSADRCLNFMSLFHLSGLVTAVLGTLSTGGSLVCVPGFQAEEFFRWLEEFQPTWYTAVPTIHQAIADRAETEPCRAQSTSLRQIRSSAAPLQAALQARLEHLFQVPVIESYGMTETHLIASNPLPPRIRKAGSVGLPAGPEVAILGPDGRLLAAGGSGEIVLRGANVFNGYQDQPDADRAAFVDGWFRTGDLGRFDLDGYLFILGRVKDIINRGGQKISPWEVEDILQTHPAVKEAVVFPVPHLRLGEAVAAAVVLQSACAAREIALLRFLQGRVSLYKVPQRILLVAEIPRAPSGKIQRNLLANRWKDLLAHQPEQVPEAGMEDATAEDWAQAAATEAALLKHSALAGCAVLPVKDRRGQLHLAAFLVLRQAISQQDTTQFLMQEGPGCIIPSTFVLLKDLPRDSAGRVDFAQLAAIPVQVNSLSNPQLSLELILARIWKDTLLAGPDSLKDDFFLCGGDSLKAVELLLRIDQELGVRIAPEAFFRCPTLEGLFLAIQAGSESKGSGLVGVQETGSGTPFFYFHGDFNSWGFYCPRFARLLGTDQRFFTFQPDGLPGQPEPTCIEAMVDRYLPLLKAVQPAGPYFLGGHCNGALLAFEMARRLEAAGDAIGLLAMVSPPPASEPGQIALLAIPPEFQIKKQVPRVRQALLFVRYAHMIRSYQPKTIQARIHLLATAFDLNRSGAALGWGAYAGEVEVCPVPGNHHSLLSNHLEALASCIRPLLQAPTSGMIGKQ